MNLEGLGESMSGLVQLKKTNGDLRFYARREGVINHSMHKHCHI